MPFATLLQQGTLLAWIYPASFRDIIANGFTLAIQVISVFCQQAASILSAFTQTPAVAVGPLALRGGAKIPSWGLQQAMDLLPRLLLGRSPAAIRVAHAHIRLLHKLWVFAATEPIATRQPYRVLYGFSPPRLLTPLTAQRSAPFMVSVVSGIRRDIFGESIVPCGLSHLAADLYKAVAAPPVAAPRVVAPPVVAPPAAPARRRRALRLQPLPAALLPVRRTSTAFRRSRLSLPGDGQDDLVRCAPCHTHRLARSSAYAPAPPGPDPAAWRPSPFTAEDYDAENYAAWWSTRFVGVPAETLDDSLASPPRRSASAPRAAAEAADADDADNDNDDDAAPGETLPPLWPRHIPLSRYYLAQARWQRENPCAWEDYCGQVRERRERTEQHELARRLRSQEEGRGAFARTQFRRRVVVLEGQELDPWWRQQQQQQQPLDAPPAVRGVEGGAERSGGFSWADDETDGPGELPVFE